MRAPLGARILVSALHWSRFHAHARRSAASPSADRLDSGIEPTERLSAKTGNIRMNARVAAGGQRVVTCSQQRLRRRQRMDDRDAQ